MTTREQIKKTILHLERRFLLSKNLGCDKNNENSEFYRGYAWGIHQATIDLLKCMNGSVLSEEETTEYIDKFLAS